MAGDAFLKIKGIEGDSTDDKHKNWIEVLSYNFGAIQSAQVGSSSGGGGGARTSGRVKLQDFTFSKMVDKASPKLFLFCCNGAHIDDITLEIFKATGENKTKYVEVKLSDSIISSYSPGGAGESLPMESVSVNFKKIEYIYTDTDSKGTKTGDVKAHWDTGTNKGG